MRHREGGGLQYGADGHCGRANENRLLSAKPLTNGKGSHGAKKAANSVDRRDDSQEIGLSVSMEVMNSQIVI